MLALLASEKAVFGIVVGVPLIVGAVLLLASSRRVRGPVVGGATLLAAGLVALAVSPAFQPGPRIVDVPAAPMSGASPPPQRTLPSPAETVPPTTSPSPTGGTGGQEPACSPAGDRVQVVAEGIAFDQECLAAPADTAFSIVFDNEDAGIPHNVAIYESDPNAGDARALFQGEVFPGRRTETYRVEALPTGTYVFRCDVHPQMQGEFVVA